MLIRDAHQDELAEVGELRLAAYRADGFLSPDSTYAPRLRDLGADGSGPVLVAVDGEPGRLLGTVMLQRWPYAGHVVAGPDEAEIRALAVRPAAQRGGVGRALLTAVTERAVREGVRHLVLLTQPEMKTAHRLYEEAGFVRLPDRDWSPEPGTMLLAYGKRLPDRDGRRAGPAPDVVPVASEADQVGR
jgi:ribosomal protein S18 acetylase RimI-like enzyme